MKVLVLVTFMLCIFALPATTLTFEMTNQLMNWGSTWMYDEDASPYLFDPANPIYANQDLCYTRRSYAFPQSSGPIVYSPVSTSQLISFDDCAPLNSVSLPDTTYHFVFGDLGSGEEFRLSSFNHMNTNNVDAPWNIANQAGDTRIYSGATMSVERNISTNPAVYTPQVKLKLVQCSFYNITPYPSPVGNGSNIYGYGWGTIDYNSGDPAWIAEFSNSSGNVLFLYNSSISTVQSGFSLNNSVLTLMPAPFKSVVRSAFALSLPAQFDVSADNDIVLNIQSSDNYGTPNVDNICNAMVSKTYFEPTGAFPISIDKVYAGAYWQLGTNANTCTTTIDFNLDHIPGISIPQNMRILRRSYGFGDTWQIVNSVLISTSPIILEVSGTDITGQYCLGSTGGNNLVEAEAFNIRIRNFTNIEDYIEIAWDLIPEALYYNIYSANTPNAPEGDWIHVAHLQDPIHVYTSGVAERKFYRLTVEK